MTDREFLETQTRLVRHRLGRSAGALGTELERAIAPTVREHPRTCLAAGAVAGALVGRGLAPASGARQAGKRGPISGTWSFVKGTGIYALRAWLVGSLLRPGHGDDAGDAPEP